MGPHAGALLGLARLCTSTHLAMRSSSCSGSSNDPSSSASVAPTSLTLRGRGGVSSGRLWRVAHAGRGGESSGRLWCVAHNKKKCGLVVDALTAP